MNSTQLHNVVQLISKASEKYYKGLAQEAYDDYMQGSKQIVYLLSSQTFNEDQGQMSTKDIESVFSFLHSILTMAESVLLQTDTSPSKRSKYALTSLDNLSDIFSATSRRESIYSSSSDVSSNKGIKEKVGEQIQKFIPTINLTSPNGRKEDDLQSKASSSLSRRSKHKHNLSDGGTGSIMNLNSGTTFIGSIINNTILETIANVAFVPAKLSQSLDDSTKSLSIPNIPFSPLEFELKHSLEEYKNFKRQTLKLHINFDSTSPVPGILSDKDAHYFSHLKKLSEKLSFWKVKCSMIQTMKEAASDSSKFNITVLHPDQIAYQLTLIDRVLQRMIVPEKDFLFKDGKKQFFTDFFNYWTRIIEHSILDHPDPEGRALRIHSWDKVAVKLYELKNFNSLKAVLSGLCTSPIRRLKKTWSLVSKKHLASIEQLQELMSEQNNYDNYRKALISASRPAIPFFGVMIYDLTYLQAAKKARKDVRGDVSSEEKKINEIIFQFDYFRDGTSYETDPKFGICGHKHHARENSFFRKLEDNAEDKLVCNPWFVSHWILTRNFFSDKTIVEMSHLAEPSHNNTKSEESLVLPPRRKSIVEYFSPALLTKNISLSSSFSNDAYFTPKQEPVSTEINHPNSIDNHRRTKSENVFNSNLKESKKNESIERNTSAFFKN